MVVSEFQADDSKAPVGIAGEQIVASNEPSNPPPYTSPTSASASSSTNPTPQPRCNYLLEHKTNSGVKGTWHVDTSLSIPESLLAPITDFDGHWNENAQKRRTNKKPSPSEIRPNLMLFSEYGETKGDVHVLPNEKARAAIVAEGRNGSVHLDVNAPPGQSLWIHAFSAYGEVKVWIPSSFEGALMIGTSYGEIKISDGVKAKLTIFSSKSEQSRGYIGDWHSSGFGTTQSNDDSGSSTPEDPFINWSGSMIGIGSKNGSVSLAFLEEKVSPNSGLGLTGPRRFSSFFSGLFGAGGSGQSGDTSSQNQTGPPQPRLIHNSL